MTQTHLSLTFAPALPLWLIAAGAMAALVLIVLLWRARRQTPAMLARLAAAAVLTLALLDPRMERQQRQPLESIAVVLTDDSLSQAVNGRRQRARKAEGLLRQRLAAIKGLQTRFVTLPPAPGRDGTRLIHALREALADVPPERFAGAMLITDGQVHDMPRDARAALPPGYDAPVHVLIDGRKDMPDRRVVIRQAPRYGIVGKDRTIRFTITQTPPPAPGARIRVTIRTGGEEWGVLSVRPGEPVNLDLPVAHAGQNILEIIAAPMPGGELSLRNNHAVIITKGVRDRLRVLLISGEPHPGERTWRDLLKSDPSVDLVHFTILRSPEKQDGTPIRELSLIAFPTRELFVDKLDSFDLVIFDRYQRRSILPAAYMENVADYVNNGGAVLFTAGPEFAGVFSLSRTRLKSVIPASPAGVLEQPYRPRLSATGLRHPVTRGLAGANATATTAPTWGRWFRIVRSHAAPGAQVLMTGPRKSPLLVLARRGEGRIAALLSSQIWLWARKYDGGGPHVELLRRLAHWLMKEPELEEEALSGASEDGGLRITRRSMKTDLPPLRVTGPDGKVRELPLRQRAPGIFTAMLKNAPPGLYRLQNGALERLAAVGGLNTLESRALAATGSILAPLAAFTGGAVRWIARGQKEVFVPRVIMMPQGRAMSGGGWLGLKKSQASRLIATSRIGLFSTLPMLAAALLLLALAWRLEGR